MKTSFESDYNNGAHPKVLSHLVETNRAQSASYGYDTWSEQAREKIRKACQTPYADIFFLVGGTQANATVIDAMLPSYGAVIAVETAHINVHESGAIEANGHKVIALPSHEGRMHADELENYLTRFFADPTWEHMAVPGMVYITFPTELGTLYKAADIEAIHQVCQKYSLPLFVDGARIGYGLSSPECDFIATCSILVEPRSELFVARLLSFHTKHHAVSSPWSSVMERSWPRADSRAFSSMPFSPMSSTWK